MTAKCIRCGTAAPGTGQFCSICGDRLPKSGPAGLAPVIALAPPTSGVTPPPLVTTRLRRPWFHYGVIAICAAGVLTGLQSLLFLPESDFFVASIGICGFSAVPLCCYGFVDRFFIHRGIPLVSHPRLRWTAAGLFISAMVMQLIPLTQVAVINARRVGENQTPGLHLSPTGLFAIRYNPQDWSSITPTIDQLTELQLGHKSGKSVIFVSTEPRTIAVSQLKQEVLHEMTASGLNPTVLDNGVRNLQGKEIGFFVVRANAPQNTCIYYEYLYSCPRGTLMIVSSSDSAAFAQLRPEIQKVLDGLDLSSN